MQFLRNQFEHALLHESKTNDIFQPVNQNRPEKKDRVRSDWPMNKTSEFEPNTNDRTTTRERQNYYNFDKKKP